MRAEDKIITFQSIDDLITVINDDRNKATRNRYPVRFILFDNFDDFQSFSLKLNEFNVNVLGLESLLPNNNKDVWISNDQISDAVKSLQDNSIIVPFSEIVRFYDNDDFNAIFHGLSKLENNNSNSSRRLYIPLIGIKRRFFDFIDSISRTTEIAPVWSVDAGIEYSVKVFLTQKHIKNPVKEYRGIETMYDWLQFWKSNPTPEKVVCSSLPINDYAENSKPDNIFTPIRINSAYDFIVKYHDLSMDIPYKTNEEVFWQQLLSHISDNAFSLKSFVENRFNVRKLSAKELLNKWTSADATEFDRWLLKQYYLYFVSNDDEYLNGIILNSEDYSPLKLFKEIALDTTNKKESIEARNILLSFFDKQYKLPDSDLSELKEQILNIAQFDSEKAIALCSGRFDFEKELLVEWYKNGTLKIDKLKKLYPDFVTYQSDIGNDGWANTYINVYKQAKIKNEYTDEIKDLIAEKNANEESFWQWYHNFELSKELLAKEKPDKVYWIDGLGIEYLSLIQNIINSSDFKIEKLKVAKTGIPSSTEHNKFENIEKISDLDDFIHSEKYQYPQTICKEIDIVKIIFKKILNQTTKTTIAIVSDHGLTALSRLVDSKKYTVKASHEGRYIKLESEERIKDTDYILHTNGGDNFKVALTHASLNTKPLREVHGGCTPEEILVPFIVISNKREDNVTKPPNIVEQKSTEETSLKKATGFEEELLF